MPARLTIHLPRRPARRVVLRDEGEIVVGRAPDCDLVLDDDRISRRHARLAAPAEGWELTDLGSKNGTAVDGVPVERARLGPSHWLSFGGLLSRFERISEASEAAERAGRQRRVQDSLSSLELVQRLDPAAGLAVLLEKVLASMLELSGAERGLVLLSRPEGDLEVAARVGLDWSELASAEFSGSVSAVERVLATGEPTASCDVGCDQLLAAQPSVVREGIRALVCLPIPSLERRLGVMYADSRRPGAVFTELDLEILEALAAQAGLAIATARLNRELEGLVHLAGQGVRLDATLDSAPGGRLPWTWHGLLASRQAALEAGR